LGHVPALNGVRGLAILLVLACHFFNLSAGFYGVDLFFVLSGFLITTLLLEERDRDGAIRLRAFYLRRARRLLPAIGTLVVAFVALAAAVGRLTHGLAIAGEGGLYAGNFVRAFVHPDPLTREPLNHLWSLAEEEQFYLLWPPILLLALQRRVRENRLLVALLAVAVALMAYRVGLAIAGARPTRIYYAPDTHADGIVIGCALAFLRRRGMLISGAIAWPALTGIVVLASLGSGSASWSAYGLPVVELASAAIVLGACGTGAFAAGLSWRPLVYLGTISYSIYIWHEFARWLVIGPRPWIELPFAIAFSLLSYYFVESRFRHASRRTEHAPAAAAAAIP
jgi:peptidoglycan/LPS O-acetylase OafA/YrhL